MSDAPAPAVHPYTFAARPGRVASLCRLLRGEARARRRMAERSDFVPAPGKRNRHLVSAEELDAIAHQLAEQLSERARRWALGGPEEQPPAELDAEEGADAIPWGIWVHPRGHLVGRWLMDGSRPRRFPTLTAARLWLRDHTRRPSEMPGATFEPRRFDGAREG